MASSLVAGDPGELGELTLSVTQTQRYRHRHRHRHSDRHRQTQTYRQTDIAKTSKLY